MGNAFQIHPKAIGRGPQFTFNCSASPHLKYLFPLFLLSRTLLCNHQLRDLSITVGTQVKRQCFSRFPFSQLLCSVQHRPRSSRFRIFWLRDRQMAQMKRLIVSFPIEIHSTRVIQRSRRSVFPKHHHSCRSSLPGDHQHSIGLHAKWNNRNISPSACAMHVWRIILSRLARLLELQLCPRRALSSDRRLLQHHYHICLERSLHRHTDRFLRGYILEFEQRSCSHGYGYCYERPIP